MSTDSNKLDLRDLIIILSITLIYSVAAFMNLGDMSAPETQWEAHFDQHVIIDFGSVKDISQIQYFLGSKEERQLEVSFSHTSKEWSDPELIEAVSVFAWGSKTVNHTAQYAKITAKSNIVYLKELAFKDKNNALIPVVSVSASGKQLFDEPHLVPEKYTNLNSTYFDEIYHPRTAYEYLNHLPVYETTHPPLGKSIISLGIYIFGMNPFGWRVMGVIFGIFMTPFIYVFAKKIFNSYGFAAFTSFVFTFDFMHLAQTRLATIDTYVTFFIIGMYYFMYKYYKMSFYTHKLSHTFIPLFFSGVFMGLAMASKWQGVYAAFGLAVIFFYTLYERYNEYRFNKEEYYLFVEYAATTILSCFVFFLIIPALIYAASYWQYLQTPGEDGIKAIIDSQKTMFSYHSNLESTHPYSSKWWSWPFDLRPIFYYVERIPNGTTAAISSFGNPAVWWCGVAAFFYGCYQAFAKKDKDALFLIIAFLSQYLPWAFVDRATFIYHFFPSVPFIVLLIGLMFKKYIYVKSKRLVYVYAALVILLFIMFYPVLTAIYIDPIYVHTFLEWFVSWTLI